MNPDYCSNIQVVDRFIFDQNLYMLTMFEKKITSFSSSTMWENKDYRKQNKQVGSHPTTIVDCDNYLDDPFDSLKRDLTKPVWNCTTKVDPKVIYRRESEMQPTQMLNTINRIMHSFFQRLKNQHQDQSNMKINLESFDFDTYAQNESKDSSQLKCSELQLYVSQLFKMLISFSDWQLEKISNQMENQRIQQQKAYSLKLVLMSAKEIFCFYLDKLDDNFMKQVNVCNKIIVSSLNDVISCKIGSLSLCLSPKLMTLPLFIHPILVSIHSLFQVQLKQLKQQRKKQQLREQKNAQNGVYFNRNQNTNGNSPQKKKENEEDIIFPQLQRSESISKIVFINLDGYQSQFNIEVARYLSKSLMYISFPQQIEGQGVHENSSLQQMEDLKSQNLLQKYMMGSLSPEQKKRVFKCYKQNQKQVNQNMYIYPLFSKNLKKKYNIEGITGYQSQFIYFMMKQFLFNQILDFNPSTIIISYSQKIQVSSEYFIQLLKQFTILANYKVVFYPNLSRNYMFEQYYSQDSANYYLKQHQQQYFLTYEQGMKLLRQPKNKVNDKEKTISSIQINTDIFEKLSMAIKISSGTYNLYKNMESENFIEKYKNYKLICYVSKLIPMLIDDFPNLSKMNLRMADYSIMSKVLHNYFSNKTETFDKYFNKTVPKYYILLFKQIERLLLQQPKDKTTLQFSLSNSKFFTETQISSSQQVRREKSESVLEELKMLILKKYSGKQLMEKWNNFKFQKSLQIGTQKIQSKYFLHIPRYQEFPRSQQHRKQADSLICVEFFTIIDKEKHSIEISSSTSKIYYSRLRKHKQALVFVMNCLVKISSAAFVNYFGYITQEIDNKASPKVQLFPVSFSGGPELTPYQTFTQFNYFETKNYIFLFWPKIYDLRKEALSKFGGLKYTPEQTSLLFCSLRKQAGNFFSIQVSKQIQYIIPRHGCECYQLQGTNTIYIMGGFYGDEKNYLNFQTDITKLVYKSSNMDKIPEILISQVGKQFYYDYKELETNKEVKIITKIKNDMIRPKIQYQFLELEEQVKRGDMDQGQGSQVKQNEGSEQNLKIVFLVGGIGQNFLRSYSLINHMAHKLIFNKRTGDLQSIHRIPMNNVIPVNVHHPLKIRSQMESKILSHAENRSINFIRGQSSATAFSFYHNRLVYQRQNQRFQYQNQYQFCDNDYKTYKEDISLIKRLTFENRSKGAGIQAQNSKGKDYHTNFVTITLENDNRYVLQLQLSVSLQVKHIHKDLPSTVRLTGESIISIDTNTTVIYALIKHPIYTLDECILAYYDLNDLSIRFKENKPVEVQLKQLHKFDQNVSQNILIAANSITILILHGQRFQQSANIYEAIIRRPRKKHLKIQSIQPNQSFHGQKSYERNFSQQNKQFFMETNNFVTGGLSCSIFYNQGNGIILCFSFKTIQRQRKQNIEYVYIVIEKLDLSQQKYGWQLILRKKFKFLFEQNISNQRRREKLRIVEIIQHKNLNQSNKSLYQFVAVTNQQCFSGKFSFDLQNEVRFQASGKTEAQYYRQMTQSNTKPSSILLQKNLEDYYSSMGSKQRMERAEEMEEDL